MNNDDIKKLFPSDKDEQKVSDRDYDYLYGRISALEMTVKNLVLKTTKISALESRLIRLERRR